jgi:hypothetical protein
MLYATVVVDLPSVEGRRAMGPIEWVRSLFGGELDLRSGKDELTIGALSLLEGILDACRKAGIKNAISFLVDKKVVYLDPNDVDDDVSLILSACERAGVLDKKFREMHLALAHREAGVHAIIDIEIKNEVMLGEEEMGVTFTGRPEGLRVQSGETAPEYAERVRAFAKDGEAMESARRALDALADRFAHALRTSIAGAKVTALAAEIRLIAPESPQIARFRRLGFGGEIEEPGYRALPTYRRAGAYADPFYYYYYDPYYDFTNWLMLDTLLHHSYAHASLVHVVDPRGAELFTADAAPAGGLWGSDVVSFDGAGQIAVDPSIPDGSAGPSFADSFGATGSDEEWGSIAHSGDGAPGSDDSSSSESSCSSSSCSSGSSCGSSCSSGSSCGSSCGSQD